MTPEALSAVLDPPTIPGLNAYEHYLARAWISGFHMLYDSIEFQAHVGGGIDPGPEYNASMRKMYRHNSQKRIDILCRGPWGVTLVEIKHKLDLAQLGQLIGYRWLWVHEHSDPHECVELLALGFECLEDVAHVMRANGVRLLLYDKPPHLANVIPL